MRNPYEKARERGRIRKPITRCSAPKCVAPLLAEWAGLHANDNYCPLHQNLVPEMTECGKCGEPREVGLRCGPCDTARVQAYRARKQALGECRNGHLWKDPRVRLTGTGYVERCRVCNVGKTLPEWATTAKAILPDPFDMP